MPNWIPRQTIQEQLSDEIAKQEAIRFVQASQRSVTPAWTPLLTEPVNNTPKAGTVIPKTGTARVTTPVIDPTISNNFQDFTPIQQEIANYMPAEYRQPAIRSQSVTLDTPIETSVPKSGTVTPLNKADVKPAEPFWQRALQVFSAPFNWIDEYLIKPGLSIATTSVGAVANVERKPGEEYFDWKRRSWNEWEAPGVDINVPWSDNPWRVDIKGIAEFAPWLLIPGAGQVGSATRAGAGIAGALGKAGKVGKVAGAIVEWSPWGIAEKTAGAAIKGTLKAVVKASEAVTTKLEAKAFGKIPKVVPTQTEQELTQFFKDAVVPQRKAFEKALPELRAKQETMAQKYLEQGRKGVIPQAQAVDLAAKARAGGIKEQFAVMPKQAISYNDFTRRDNLFNENFNKKISEAAIYASNHEGKLSKDFTGKVLTVREALSPPLANQFSDEVLNTEIWFTSNMNNNPFRGFALGTNQEGRRIIIMHPEQAEASYVPLLVHELKHRADELVGKIVPPTGEGKYSDLIKVPAERRARQAEKGILQKAYKDSGLPMFVPLNDPTKVQEILSKINRGAESGLATVDDAWAMRKLLLDGELPEPAQIKSFANIFGQDFAQAVSSLRSVKRSALDTIWDTLNIPRSVMASGDLSGTFRQGLILTLNHPIEGAKAFGKQLKAFASEKVAMELDDTLRAHPLYSAAKNEWGVDFTAIRKGALQGREEAFVSQLAEHLPMVRRSERAYTTYLNQMRMAVVEKAHATMISQGATKEQFKLLGGFINYSTGRGNLPFQYEKYAPMFNSLLFSPKYQASIMQLPGQVGKMLMSKNPYVRKEGAKALVTFVGGGSALLGLLSATGKGSVELDPRSVDFAKLKIGDTRIDIWRGYAQYVRFANQMLLGQRKSAFGNLSTAERGDIAGRFIQSKLSPVAGLMADLWRNETYDGKPVFSDTQGFVKSAKEHLLPLAVQDVMDAVEQSGVNGLWVAAPANLGIGVMTYVNEYVNAKNKIAKENGYESWDAIDPKTQLQIQRNSPALQAAEIEYDRQTMGTAWGDWHLAGKATEEVFSENVSAAVAQFKETGDGVQFRDKISDAYMQRKGGYEARTKEERFADIVDRLNTQDPAQAMVTLGPEQMAIKTYNDALYGEDMYDEFKDYRYDEAEIRKQQLRSYLGDKMYKYVEDYVGEKTADLPPEFQELKAAKIALRPYWQVADNVERLFGKRFAESNKGQAMISKKRKQMRATRPDIAKYYQLFYSNQ